jgi:hypothetical protein
MPTTTTPKGRAAIEVPDYGYDYGTTLHGQLADDCFGILSDHLPTRWTGEQTVADTAYIDVVHNFGLSADDLDFMIFESGSRLSDADVAADYTISYPDTDTLRITNSSGGPKTFDAMIFSHRLRNQVITISATDTLSNAGDAVVLSSLSGDVTTTLPPAASSKGRTLVFKKTEASHTWTIDGNASETIDGATTYDLTDQYEFVIVVCNGSGWDIVGSTSADAVVKAIPDTIVDITSSQTWAVPAGVGRVKVVAVGAGGDGGDASATSTAGTLTNAAGGGGGGGGMSIKTIDVSPSDDISITISSGNATVAHTPTSTTLFAGKGSDGVDQTKTDATVGTGGQGGQGGTASGGDINLVGGDGSLSTYDRGGCGGAIGTSHAFDYCSARWANNDKVFKAGASYFWSSSESRRTTNKYGVAAGLPTSIELTFPQYLLNKTSPMIKVGDDTFFQSAGANTNGINGFPGIISTDPNTGSGTTNGTSGSETGGGAGANGGSTVGGYSGGTGGSIGAGGGGASAVIFGVSGTRNGTGGTGGAAHCYIVF